MDDHDATCTDARYWRERALNAEHALAEVRRALVEIERQKDGWLRSALETMDMWRDG